MLVVVHNVSGLLKAAMSAAFLSIHEWFVIQLITPNRWNKISCHHQALHSKFGFGQQHQFVSLHIAII